MTASRPTVTVFDVVETLASLDPVADRLAEVTGGSGAMTAWFTHLLRDAMALSAAGDYRPFAEVATESLDAYTRHTLDRASIEHVVAGFGALTPQPDAVAAVHAAVEHGFEVAVLSNGSEANTRGFLDRAGVAESVGRVFSIDAVRRWKPSREPYDHVVTSTGHGADRHALVAVHSWDIHGAHRAGWTTGWCPRLEGTPDASFAVADVTAPTLDGVIHGLAALTDGPGR